ncbi:hypothetical protein B0H63DRAFT_434520 [Podospora didyma]|uniref:Ubiquitin carboxyl-terminal hydrolase n=1 Tax=Podospora didyma TaxID=330526 RepID=A0AAE0NGJ0_9PEZI|nr:hypothetical protein B0H63DRAFT_434520 [Podospora didyma]
MPRVWLPWVVTPAIFLPNDAILVPLLFGLILATLFLVSLVCVRLVTICLTWWLLPLKPSSFLPPSSLSSKENMAQKIEMGNDAAASQPPRPLRVFTMLENNPDVMNALARRLGVSEELAFYDVYSLYDEEMMALVPRPVYALLVTIPMNPAWRQDRNTEDAGHEWYRGSGPDEPVLWLQQTVIHGCGLIGLLHCVANGVPAEMIVPGSVLADFVDKATPLGMADRAQLLNDTDTLHDASEAVSALGDSRVLGEEEDSPHHFVALVKGRDGNLWELEGARKGPLNRGSLGEDEDAFSERALELGIRRLVEIQRQSGGDLPFSCIALARA